MRPSLSSLLQPQPPVDQHGTSRGHPTPSAPRKAVNRYAAGMITAP